MSKMYSKVEFTVDGRPPRKFRGGSVWSSDDEAPLVKKLREHALQARNDVLMYQAFDCPVRLDITIYAKNTLYYRDSHNYVGDIDGFVSGVLEALESLNEQVIPHKIFEDSKMNPKTAMLFENDAQVVEVHAKKIQSEDPSYIISVQVATES
jgi:hypothetical protein